MLDGVIKALNDQGFQPTDVQPDGKIHRFKRTPSDKNKDAWYVCYQWNARDGSVAYNAVFADWHDSEVHHYSTLNGSANAEDRALLKKQIEKAKAKAEAEEEEDRATLRAHCLEVLPTLGHEMTEYAKCKRLTSLRNAYSDDGLTIIPALDEHGIAHGYQFIKPNGEKRWKLHTPKKGKFFPIGDPTQRIWLTEGWATGMTVHEATGELTIVCFDAGNVMSVLPTIRRMYPKAQIFLAGDNDDAGHAINMTGYFPTGTHIDKEGNVKGNDWNDEGVESCRAALSMKKQEPVRCLGFKHQQYYYTSETNRQIVDFSAAQHSSNSLLNLMPYEWWETQFPGKKGVDWTRANSWLMSSCRARGIFSPKNVRGTGVWEDNGIRINCGDKVFPNDPMGKYTYIISDEVPLPGQIASDDDVELLTSVVSKLSWSSDQSWKLFAGWLTIAPFCGILQWRPHLWLTGGSGTGKSTVVESIATPILGLYKHYVRGATTEAGIRQTMCHNALPVVFDEFETNDNKSAEKVKYVLDLMRQASSESSSEIVKGSSSGEAIQYSPKFCALVSSIRTNLQNDADISRFTVIELSNEKLPEGKYREIEKKFALFDAEYSIRMFSRTYSMLDKFKENQRRLWGLINVRYTARFAQQYSTLLAGYSLLSGETPEEIMLTFDFGLFVSADAERDHYECLNYLIHKMVPVDVGHSKKNISIIELIRALATNDASEGFSFEEKTSVVGPTLGRYGMKVDGDSLYIRHSHPELKKIYEQTRWANGWARSLSRLPGSLHKSTAMINGIKVAVVHIPVKVLVEGQP